MWSSYTKTFAFRDCFDEINVKGNVAAINKLLKTKQLDDEVGVFICTNLINTASATSLEAYTLEDTGEWVLQFYFDGSTVAAVTVDNFKEVQLQFEIEENLDNGDMSIHHCTIKAFKEYQM